MRQFSRREVIAASTGLAGFTFLPARVLGRGGAVPPSEKVNLAFVGIGSRASYNFRELANLGHNIVAICDVDWRKVEPRAPRPVEMAEKFSQAKKYQDWRIMLQEQNKNIDAVVVGTPDHDHAVASLAAMKMGKHVYTEKPIAHSVEEARAMIAAAKKYKVTTQSGCQGEASDAVRNVVEWIKAGAIGDVRDVRIFSHRMPPPPGSAPKAAPGRARLEYADIPKRITEDHPVPEGLNWDMWLGPAAFRPYNPLYCPVVWRTWRDFGDSTIGDMGMHHFNHIFWSLDLGYPEKVEARTDAAYTAEAARYVFPQSMEVRWEFPARGSKPPVTMTWHVGPEGGSPPLPKYWKDEYYPTYVATGKPVGDVILYTGSKGAIVTGNLAPSDPIGVIEGKSQPVVWSPPESIRLIPDELDKSFTRPPKTMPRPFNHWDQWVQALKAHKLADASFQVGGGLWAETALLGNIATRLHGQALTWDGKAGKFKNNDEANKLLKVTYREGFKLSV